MIIGLTGGMACGKLSVVKFLEEKGFIGYAFSDVLNDELKKRNIPITRKSQQDIGNELRNEGGSGAIAKKLISMMESGKNYVVDGIRNPGEIIELKNEKNFFLIAIDSSQESRFERIVSRGMERDPKTWEDFLKADARDFNEENLNGLQIKKCMDMADFVIVNNGTLDELKEKIVDVLERIET